MHPLAQPLQRLHVCLLLLFALGLRADSPVITSISEQAISPDSALGLISFSISDAETPSEQLSLNVTSTNMALVPTNAIQIGGSGSNRTLTITPTPGQRGLSRITITVVDEATNQASASFVLRVEEFTSVSITPVGWNVGASLWIDYDSDGDLDVCASASFVTNYNSYYFTTFLRNDAGTFVQAETVPLSNLSDCVPAFGDFDNDGDLDLVLSGYRYPTAVTSLHRNDGSNGFLLVTNLPGLMNGWAEWGDADNDGALDLLISGSAGSGFPYVTKIFRNHGDGTFLDLHAALPGSGLYPDLDWGDYDNDGDLDVLIAGTDAAAIVKNAGRGVFASSGVSLPLVQTAAAQWGDVDGDGWLDFVLAGDTNRYSGVVTEFSRVYHNQRDGSFTNINAALTGIDSGSVAWGDYDSDGQLDLLIAGMVSSYYVNAATKIYRNNAGALSLSISNLPSTTQKWKWGDYDNDGDLDLLLAGTIYRNNIVRTNTPPGAPANLGAAVLANHELLLTWSPSIDSQTTNHTALNYNLRIGRTPGGSEVMSAQSLPDGTRLLPKRGNAGSIASWRLVDLPHGTYYWSVQAIDPGFLGSPFATEHTFVISNSPPILSLIADQMALPHQVPAPVSFVVQDSETAPDALVVTASSSNTNVVRDADLFLSGAGTNRTLTFLTQPLPRGSTVITIQAVDSHGRVARRTFTFRIEEFTSVPAPALFSSVQVTRPGDINNDGWLDAAFGWGLYRNSDGNFARDLGSGAGRFGDYNHDGWVDSSASDRIYANASGGSFSNVLIIRHPFLSVHTTAWADSDSDGDLDLFVSGTAYDQINGVGRIQRNNGNGTFTLVDIGVLGGRGPVAWADFDNDGDMDVMAAGGYPSEVPRLYRNDGNDQFTLISWITGSFYSARNLAWGDFNNDGRPDLVVAGEPAWNSPENLHVTRIYRNDGPGPTNSWVFTDIQANLPGLYGWFIEQSVGDYDHDGWLDLLLAQVSGATNVFRIFRNHAGETFTDIGADLYGATAFGDADNDGDLDVLMGANSVWFRNNTVSTNAIPSAPAAPLATPMRTGVRLSWIPGVDANQSGGLTYNLRVGRSPGAMDIMSPQSDLTTGKRRLPQAGNAGSGPAWHLTNLAVGTYYWSVQSVDHSYAGSMWTPEQVFVIPEQPPVVMTHFATDVGRATAMLTGEVVPNGFATAYRFEYGTNTSYENATPWMSIGNGTNSNAASAFVSGLLVSTLYHFRIVATNVNGITHGVDVTFFTRGFAGVPIHFSIGGNGVAAWGDSDRDGDLDLALISSAGTYVYRNLGNDQFEASAPLPGGAAGAVRWGDLDNDGYLDLLVCGIASASRSTRIYRNNGDNTFTDLLINLIKSVDGAWLDFNNDGRQDVVVVGPEESRVYANAGGGTLNSVSLGSYAGADSVACGDYNGDGYLDLLLNGGSTYQPAQIFRNNRDGTFSTVASLAHVYNGSVDWGDFDNDGRLDVLLTGWENSYDYSAQTVVYRNLGGGAFGAIAANLPPLYGGFAGWGDYNADGALDILFAGPRVFRGEGTGFFRNISVDLTASASISGWGDYDNDGDLDYYGWWPGQIHNNLNLRSNSPPAAPANLVATILSSNDVLLTWDSAVDPETSDSRGLSYSLRIGSTPGGIDILAPFADPATGFRRVPQMGNVKSNAWILRGAPRGTFHWSVQAVDGGFAGSPFAAEGTFNVTNDRPHISPIPDNAVAPGHFPAAIPFTVSDDFTLPEELLLTARSSNTSFLSNADVAITGTGTNRLLTLSATTTNTGTTTIMLTATDANGLVTSRSFRFSVEWFTPLNLPLPTGTSVSMSWGDYDNDDDLDLAVSATDYSKPAMKIFRNDGGGDFTDMDFGFVASGTGPLQWLDVNNDGRLDLFVFGGTNAGIHLNQPDGTFLRTDSLTGQPVPFQPMAADFNHDGRIDLLLAGPTSPARILFNQNGSFSTGGMSVPFGAGGAAAADFDRDGDLDIFVSGQQPRVFLNDGAGAFTPSLSAFPAATSGTAAAADFDGDGHVDLAMSGWMMTLYLYRNNGDATFTLMSTNLPGNGQGSLSAADFDNDGRTDLLMSGCLGYCSGDQGFTLRVLRNDGAWNFTQRYFAYGGSSTATWADFDGDGDLDIAHNGSSRLLRNNWNSPQAAPNVPTILTTTPTGDGVTFSWTGSTQASSHALRIGTTPGGFDVLAPESNPVTGQRRIAAPGPAINTWTLRWPLAAGDYYWSVQAIGTAWVGSPFAPERTLHVPNLRPIARAFALTINEDTEGWHPLSASDMNGDPITFALLSAPTNGTLTLTDSWARYRPNTNYFGPDSFIFEAHDGVTNSEPVLVPIRVINLIDSSSTRLSLAMTEATIQLNLQGEPHQRYAIDVSEDLIAWNQLAIVQASAAGAASFAAASGPGPHRFYRARAIP